MNNFESTSVDSPTVEGPIRPSLPAPERIAARSAEVGKGMLVHRAIPSRERRMVGAWCFLDHAGPVEFGRGEGLNVGPHPHIGLQTFTWMIEGEVLHRDSLGYEQLIRPGQVNLMTAGRGIVHAEESVSAQPGRVHAAQLWIALPDRERHRGPAFQHCPDLPRIEDGGFVVTVLAGTAFGQTAPPQVFTPLMGIDMVAEGPARIEVPLSPGFEHAALCLSGSITVAGERIEPGTLLYLGLGRDSVNVTTDRAARLLLIGGEPFDEDVLLWWNFVGRSHEEMVRATEDWNARRHFGDVPRTQLPRLVAPDITGMHLHEPRK